jgi:ATP-dependent helicase/nuclease subunit B
VPIREIVNQFVELLERFDVRTTMGRWLQQAAAGAQIEQHDEHLQVWTNLMDLLDQMVDLLGDEPATAVQFLEILDFGLERFDLALTPPTIDQVLVGNVDRTRNPQSRAVVLLSLNDGQFPHGGREDSIFSDGERRWLTDRRVDLERDARRRLFDESLLAYIGCTRASEALTFCRALADLQQRPQSPSVIWRRVREIFPELVPMRMPREMDAAPQCIGTPRQLVTQLMRWVRTSPEGIESRDSPWPALFQWLATRNHQNDALDIMRGRAWRALSYSNSAWLSPNVSARLLRSPLRASVSRLETYASCPFKHFARYVLDLERREDPDVTAIDLGNVYHEVLEQIVSRMVEARQGWNDVPLERRTAAIKSCVASVGQSLRGELMLSTARNRYLLQRIEQTLSLVIAAHEAAARRNRLRPLATELSFGFSGAGLPAHAITTPRGWVVELRGKIDRVDVLEDEHAFAVIDYKLSGDSLELDRVYHGLALQLLTYLLVLQAAGEKLFGRPLTPAAAFYIKLMRKLATRNHPDDATDPGDPLFDLEEVPRGIFDAAYFGALDTVTGQGRSASVRAHIKTDGNFGDRNRSDAADAGEFAGLLKLVQRRVGELADRILDGDISITPYRLKSESPCQRCEFLAVCRFDTQFNSYHALDSMTRTQVLNKVTQEKQRAR